MLISLVLALTSCNLKDSNEPKSVKTIKKENDVIMKDTIITYNFDGIRCVYETGLSIRP